MQIGTLVLGIVIGVILAWIWLDREGLKDRLLSVRDTASEHAPSGEQTAETGKAVLVFVRRYWLVCLVVVVLLIWVASSLLQQVSQIPTINLGLNTLEDRCGVSQVVNVTIEDVRRGQIVVGKINCQRIITLSPGN